MAFDYISSEYIRVTPCANRTVDQEAKLITERTLTHIPSIAGAESYVLSDSGPLEFVVGGYYVTIDLDAFDKSLPDNLWVYLALVDKDLFTGDDTTINSDTAVIGAATSNDGEATWSISYNVDLDEVSSGHFAGLLYTTSPANETYATSGNPSSGPVLASASTSTTASTATERFVALQIRSGGETVNVGSIGTAQIQKTGVTAGVYGPTGANYPTGTLGPTGHTAKLDYSHYEYLPDQPDNAQTFKSISYYVNEKGQIEQSTDTTFTLPGPSIAYCFGEDAESATDPESGKYGLKTAYIDRYAKTTGYFLLAFTRTNTFADRMKLQIISRHSSDDTDKVSKEAEGDLYINNVLSSSDNYDIPAGVYLVYCDGEDYYLNTEGGLKTDRLTVNDVAASTIEAAQSVEIGNVSEGTTGLSILGPTGGASGIGVSITGFATGISLTGNATGISITPTAGQTGVSIVSPTTGPTGIYVEKAKISTSGSTISVSGGSLGLSDGAKITVSKTSGAMGITTTIAPSGTGVSVSATGPTGAAMVAISGPTGRIGLSVTGGASIEAGDITAGGVTATSLSVSGGSITGELANSFTVTLNDDETEYNNSSETGVSFYAPTGPGDSYKSENIEDSDAGGVIAEYTPMQVLMSGVKDSTALTESPKQAPVWKDQNDIELDHLTRWTGYVGSITDVPALGDGDPVLATASLPEITTNGEIPVTVTLSQDVYENLKSNGEWFSGGVVYTYDENITYLTPAEDATVGAAGKLSLTAAVGSAYKPVYFTKDGVPTSCSGLTASNIGDSTNNFYLSGISTSATSPTGDINGGLYYNADIYMDKDGKLTAASYNATSDERLKTDIEDYEYHDSILDVPVREYTFKDSGQRTIGFVAQELQKVYPELVDEGANGYLTIRQDKFVYLLLEEVKKLKAEIEGLKTKID